METDIYYGDLRPMYNEKWILHAYCCMYACFILSLCTTDEEVTRKQTPPKRPGTTPKLSCATGATGADTKDPITKLKEYCEKNKLSHNVNYKEVKCGGQQFQFHVIVQGKTYVGAPQSKRQDARKTAAQKALNALLAITSV